MKVIGIRFRPVGKIYYFNPENENYNINDHVIVETIRGIEYGTVVLIEKDIDEKAFKSSIKPIIRRASKEDEDKRKLNIEKEEEAYNICKEKIKLHNLPMKLLETEYTFDRGKLIFYFAAENRIDFRELVKDLASIFRTRIELRQVGVRDEAKILGGFGCCGREFCCATHLSEFSAVSIKMVKEQGMSLNPGKISGTCGRLMCCLKNEEEAYEYLNQNLPMIGDDVTTKEGFKGVVHSVSTLLQKVKVIVDIGKEEKEIREYLASDLKFKKRKKLDNNDITEEVKELEELDKKEVNDTLED
ncbi:MAG: stage 0 sporulation family protein [Eubacteriales bacterium]|nr:stage 0 sporulation family protein [Eubacteriales bacterium]